MLIVLQYIDNRNRVIPSLTGLKSLSMPNPLILKILYSNTFLCITTLQLWKSVRGPTIFCEDAFKALQKH